MMQDMIILLFVIALVFLWMFVNLSTLDDFFSPFSLYLFIWILPFILSYLRLSGLQTGLSKETFWIVFMVSIIMVTISIFPMFLVKQKLKWTAENYYISPINNSIGFALAMIGLAFSIGFYLLIEFRSGIPIIEYFSDSAYESNLHRFGKDSKLQIISAASMALGAINFYLYTTSRILWRRWLSLLASLSVPMLGVLKASKSDIFIPILYYSAIYYYFCKANGKRIPIKRITFIALSMGVIMGWVTIIRLSGIEKISAISYSELIEFKYREVPFGIGDLAAIFYGYTALNFQNLSNYISNADESWRIGTSMLRPFLSVVMQGDIADSMLDKVTELRFVSSAATVGTFLRDLYIEGGAIFCLIGGALYAILINLLYMKYRYKKSTLYMLLYINFLFPWVWIFFQNAFSVLTFYVNAFYISSLFFVTKMIYIVLGRKTEQYKRLNNVSEKSKEVR